jgi:[protein-PII] uridylyltransferase
VLVDAKQQLADGYEVFHRRHQGNASGVELSVSFTDLRDQILLQLCEAALHDIGETDPKGFWSQAALVAHGGYGRRDVAPFSDVDLMILHAPDAGERVAPLAERLLRDVFDVGLILGHSVRTPEQACKLACADPTICTSLIESRLLHGSEPLFHRFTRQFRRQVHRHMRGLMLGILEDRSKERMRYGETVFLLEPNIKRSRGALRDLQLIRWIGFVRYGTQKFRELFNLGALEEDDLHALEKANEFLLWLRNDMHFHAKQAADVLDRSEQLRITEQLGYPAIAGLLPVEQFMRDYFRHTDAVSHIAERLVAKAQSHDRLNHWSTVFFGHRVEAGIRVGPAGMMATRQGLQLLRGDLTAMIRLADLSNLYDKPIAPSTWEVMRREASRLPHTPPPPEACRHFLSLLGHPARLGPILRDLHDAGILERFVPEFAHARGLLQFNQYHKFTVDEHCLRAVEFATDLWSDPGPLGRVYRPLSQKYLLHLALLIHDLGKGHLEDHREVGVKIAAEAGQRLGLPPQEIEALKFLTHKHMTMNHLAFRRDTADEHLAVQFAVQVGSPEMLQMLYVLTACDLGAVGPGVWDGWKTEVVTDLYHRTMQHLAGDSPETTMEHFAQHRSEAMRQALEPSDDLPWFMEHAATLPMAYLNATSPQQAIEDLRQLHALGDDGVSVATQYLEEMATVQLTVATSEKITPGIFHKLTGAISSRGLQIRAAQIHTLPDGLVIDRFWVHDPDFAGEPPRHRLEEIKQSLIQALLNPNKPPSFRRTWHIGGEPSLPVPGVPTRVNIDNSTSQEFTIIDIFTHDRTGLLYAVTRTLFELGLSVGRAKIGTFLDQVVDVFYVTDPQGLKIREESRLEEIRRQLIDVVEGDASPPPRPS